MKISILKLGDRQKFYNIKRGFKAVMPIAIGYIPIAITFGLISRSSGIPNIATFMMSLLVFAGSSQFIAVNLICMGVHPIEVVMTTFIVNFRHFIMSLALAQRFEKNVSKRMLSILAFGVTDETFAVASLEKGKLNPYFMFVLNFTAFISWNLGTLVGVFVGDALPVVLRESMGIALYAMFIGLLIPALKNSKPIWFVSIVSLATNSVLYYIPLFSSISMGWKVIISSIVSALLGALIFSEEVCE